VLVGSAELQAVFLQVWYTAVHMHM